MEIVFKPEVLFETCEPAYLSASVSELGEGAGKLTWANCLKVAALHVRPFQGKYDELRDHFREYGAWDEAEIAGWSKLELRALAIQEIASDYRQQTEYEATEVRHTLHEGKIYAYFGV